MEPGSFPGVRLFLIVTEVYAQGVKTLCDPCTKQEGSSGRSRTPSSGEGVCGRISRGVAWDAAGKGTGVYHRPETGNRIDSKNALSDVDLGVARVENATEGVVGSRTDTS
jgi:hypothetical protein